MQNSKNEKMKLKKAISAVYSGKPLKFALSYVL
jgi:hypothetical protein